jgi:hypothetical protein
MPPSGRHFSRRENVRGYVGDELPGRPYKPGPIPGNLIYDRDFKWPMAPNSDLEQTDIRGVPTKTLDLASCEMDPSQALAFVTALNVPKRPLIGYVSPRQDYP